MAEVKDISLHPIELYNEVALCIAYCIGATSEDVEQIADTITIKEIKDCISAIRSRMSNT